MDFWTPEQITKYIGIEQAFEEFCETDPELSKLDSTRPDPKGDSKVFEEWYARCYPVYHAATERFVELFREKILVALALRDDKETVLPPEYWAITLASLTVTEGKVRGLSPDDPYRHLENSRVVLLREDWEKWKVASQREAALKKTRYEQWAERQQALVSSGQAKNLREAAQKIANEEDVDLIYVERETRRVRKKKAEKSGEKREEKISSLPPLNGWPNTVKFMSGGLVPPRPPAR